MASQLSLHAFLISYFTAMNTDSIDLFELNKALNFIENRLGIYVNSPIGQITYTVDTTSDKYGKKIYSYDEVNGIIKLMQPSEYYHINILNVLKHEYSRKLKLQKIIKNLNVC